MAVGVVGVGVSGLGLYMAAGLGRLADHGPAYATATLVGVVAGLAVLVGLVAWVRRGRHRLPALAQQIPVGPWVRGMLYCVCVPVLVCIVVGSISGRVNRQVFRAASVVSWGAWWYATVGYRPAAGAGVSIWRRVCRGTDLAAFNLIVFLLLAEVALRTYARFGPKGFFLQTDAEAGLVVDSHRLRPGQIAHGFPANARGYFDTPFSQHKPPGTFRILALADSFGVGTVPYPDNFLTRLETALDARRPGTRRVEVYNTGVQAIGMREYLHILTTEGPAYDSDWVLVCVFVGNDIHRSRPATLLQKEGWTLYVAAARTWRLWRHPPRPPDRRTPTPTRPASRRDESLPTFDEDTYLAIEHTRIDVARRDRGKTARGYAYVAHVLAEIKRVTAGRVTVLIVPDEYQVDPALFAKLVHRYRLNPGDFDLDQPQRLLSETCRRLGIAYVDVLPAFRRASRHGSLYACQDSHWNTPGNHLAADLLVPIMEQTIVRTTGAPASQPMPP